MFPKVEIITTGTELMTGTTVDTNFTRAAEYMTLCGVVPSYHTSVGDDFNSLLEVLDVASKRAEVIIVSGGLGVTEDDLTVEVAASFFNLPLEFRREEFSVIERRLKERDKEASEKHRKIAFLPRGVRTIVNEVGLCPGFFYSFKGKDFYFLPGVPSEFLSMLKKTVVPEVVSKFGIKDTILLREIRTIGMSESEIARRLKDLDSRNVKIGYRIALPEIHIRLISDSSEELSDVLSEIKRRLGEYVYSDSGRMLEEVVGDMFRESNLTISTAESCTGGLLASRITDVSGSSTYFRCGVVTYSNESKIAMLGVPSEYIDKYGAVSDEVVRSMATGIRKIAGTNIGIGISGIAGPGGGTPEKPVGTVYVGVDSDFTDVTSYRFNFHGTRTEIKWITTSYVLDIIRKMLLNLV